MFYKEIFMKLSATQFIPLLIIAVLITGCADTPTESLNQEPKIIYSKPIKVKHADSIRLYPTDFNYLARWQPDTT